MAGCNSASRVAGEGWGREWKPRDMRLSRPVSSLSRKGCRFRLWARRPLFDQAALGTASIVLGALADPRADYIAVADRQLLLAMRHTQRAPRRPASDRIHIGPAAPE